MVKKYLFAVDPSQLWFLWMLFDVFAIVWPIRRVMLQKSLVGWIIALALYGIGIVGKQRIPNVFCIWTACQYIPFFFIGMRIRGKQENGERIITATIPWSIWHVFDLMVFVGEIVISNQNGFVWSIIGILISFLLHIVGAIMAWSVLQVVACQVNWEKIKCSNFFHHTLCLCTFSINR